MLIHITTANITDRSGALEAFSQHKDNLSDVSNVLADGGQTGDKFAKGIKDIIDATVMLLSAMSFIILKLFHKDGLLNALFLGLKNAGDFRKIVNVCYLQAIAWLFQLFLLCF